MAASQFPRSVIATVVAASIELSREYSWQVHHTGYSAAGGAAAAPVWLRVNEESINGVAEEKAVLLPAGMVTNFPPGVTILRYVAAGASEPVLNLIPSREAM